MKANRSGNKLVPQRIVEVILIITLLIIISPASSRAATLEAAQFETLPLTSTEVKYPIVSLKHSSGFIPVTSAQSINEAPPYYQQAMQKNIFFATYPNFNQHSRFRLYTSVTNTTDTDQWFFHISNFGFTSASILVRTHTHQTLYKIDSSQPTPNTQINVLGRAIKIDLPQNQNIEIIVDLTAKHNTWVPYLALMSETHYENWDTKLDYLYKLAIGIVLGVILVGVICWVIMRDSAFLWASVSSLFLTTYYLEHSRVPADLWQSSYNKSAIFWWLFSLTCISLLAFAASFLKIRKTHNQFFWLFVAAGITSLLLAIINPWLSFKTNSILYTFNYLSVLTIILVSGVVKFYSHGRYYAMYILGWLPIILSQLHVLLYFYVIEKNVEVVDISYKMIWALYLHILHLAIHAIAIIQRIRVLRAEKEEAERLSWAKSQFIAHSSHDLYQPLHTMNFHIHSLKPHIQDKIAIEILNKLEHSNQVMRDTFKSVMDLKKLEAGVIKAELQVINLSTIFKSLEMEFAGPASQKGLSLHIHNTRLRTKTDPDLLKRILRNLISNAIKYTKSGRVIVGCRRRNKHTEIQVIDTGPGMSKQTQRAAFDIYQRAENNTSLHDQSSGIGLSIVKHLAELLNHTITIESRLNQGCKFTLTLPITIENSSDPLSNSPRDNLDIAIVCKNKALQQHIEQKTSGWHYKTSCYKTLKEVAPETNPSINVLICDATELDNASLSQNYWKKLSKQYVLACIGLSNRPQDEHWVELQPPVDPMQLRAFLNYAERKARTENQN